MTTEDILLVGFIAMVLIVLVAAALPLRKM